MNIKSLLLGSAAALAVVSGAQAADAIVAAEPEPAEYVRVCDAFGTGYFYIPGTETCIKIGGRIRYDIKGGEYFVGDDGWSKKSRFELSVSTASDTEYGPLKTSGIIRFDNDNGSDSLDLNEATISLGGFTVGQTDSLFTTGTNYAGNVLADDAIGYGPFDTQMIKYSYDNGAGLTFGVALEQDNGVTTTDTVVFDAAGNPVGTFSDTTSGPDNDYMPNITAAVGYSAGTFGVSGAAGYDEEAGEVALKARVDGNFGGVSVFVMAAYDTGDEADGNVYAPWEGDWAAWAGLTVPASDALKVNAQVAYDDGENFAAAANVEFAVAAGFTITPEVNYYNFGDDGVDDVWGGRIRFDRKF